MTYRLNLISLLNVKLLREISTHIHLFNTTPAFSNLIPDNSVFQCLLYAEYVNILKESKQICSTMAAVYEFPSPFLGRDVMKSSKRVLCEIVHAVCRPNIHERTTRANQTLTAMTDARSHARLMFSGI